MKLLNEIGRVHGLTATKAATQPTSESVADALANTTFDAAAATKGAAEGACALLEQYNGADSLSPLHREAIHRLVDQVITAAMATRQPDDPRAVLGIPAPTGQGKSLVTSVIAAVMAMTYPQHGKRIAILTTKVRDLFALFDATASLVATPTGECSEAPSASVRQRPVMRRVALLHEYPDASKLHRCSSQAEVKECAVVFATQQKARNSHGEEWLSGFDLYLLDEDLGMWATNINKVREIRFAADVLQAAIKCDILRHTREELQCLSEYIHCCCEAVDLAIQQCGDKVLLPATGGFAAATGRGTFVDDVMRKLRRQLKKEVARIEPVITQLVEWSGSAVDVHSASDYKGAAEFILSFRTTLPSYMKSIVVLDAQAGHNVFKELAPDIQSDAWFVEHYNQLKRYDGSVLHWADIPSGRETVSPQLATLPKSSRLLKAWLDVLQNHLGADEAILTAVPKCHEPRGRSRRAKVDPDRFIKDAQRFLANNGFDPFELLPNGKPRFCFARWGQLKASNEWSHCTHFFTLSTLRRTAEDLVAQAIAATGDPTTHHETIEVVPIVANELARELTQAANRTCARRIRNGVAEPMHLWLCLAREAGLAELVITELMDQMPGLQLGAWDSMKKEIRVSASREVANATAAVLAELVDQPINTTKLRGLISDRLGRELTSTQWAKSNFDHPWALDGWRRSGRTLFRSIPEQDAA